MSGPDVSVIIAVYNTMPYLDDCLRSLVEQSIGMDRMEIIAIDDGSTDGGGAVLDRYLARYPGTVVVRHQANSGGPAAPLNRGLDLATGRYVFFIGSDDYLGAEALERMVSKADELDSDVLLGKAVGVNGRYVHQTVFRRSAEQITLFDSALPWSLSNTKLFRRSLIEKLGLRFPEDMAIGSDQPFTIEACLRARRISVLADYDYYFAVKRENADNITYRTSHTARLRSTAAIMDLAAALIGPGLDRDRLLKRHFAWELAKLFRADFLDLGSTEQRDIMAGVRELFQRYHTPEIERRLNVSQRLRLRLAHAGELNTLLSVVEYESTHGTPPTVIRDGRAVAGYPCLLAPTSTVPVEWFDNTAAALNSVKVRADQVTAKSRVFGRSALEISAHCSLPGLSAMLSTAVEIAFAPSEKPPPGSAYRRAGSTWTMASDTRGSRLRLRIPLSRAIPDGKPLRTGATVWLRLTSGETTRALAINTDIAPGTFRVADAGGLYRVSLARGRAGRLLLAATRIRFRRIVPAIIRKLQRLKGR